MSVLDRDTATQLRGMAAALDRANRPVWLVGVGALVLTVAVVLLLIAVVNYAGQRSLLAREQARSATIQGLLDDIAAAEQSRIDLEQLFPRGLIEVQVGDVVTPFQDELIERATAAGDTRAASAISFNVGPRQDRDLATNDQLRWSAVTLTFTVPEVGDLLELIRRLRSHQYLRRGFVQRLELTPSAGVWRGQLQYRMYEVKR